MLGILAIPVGLAISHALAKQGARLALSGTNPAKLRAIIRDDILMLKEKFGEDASRKLRLPSPSVPSALASDVAPSINSSFLPWG